MADRANEFTEGGTCAGNILEQLLLFARHECLPVGVSAVVYPCFGFRESLRLGPSCGQYMVV